MASVLILQATLRMFTADNFHTFTGFCLTFYIYVFAMAIIAIECNCMRARVWFYFMNFSLGKAIFYGLMAVICFSSGASVSWFDILVGCVFGLVCIMFAFFHCWFKDAEGAYVEKLITEMNDRNAAKTMRDVKHAADTAATINVNRA